MLNELKRHHDIGTKDDLTYFLQVVIGNKSIREHDIRTICLHAPGDHLLNPDALIDFCSFSKLLYKNVETNAYYLSPELMSIIDNNDAIVRQIITGTLEVLFAFEVLKPELFTYSTALNLYIFNNHYLQLDLAAIRNVLISCGFFVIQRNERNRYFVVAEEHEKVLSTYIGKNKKRMSLEQLKKQLQMNEEIGDIAEKYVMDYEMQRIYEPINSLHIKRISEIDSGAGYDIASFESSTSYIHDRFIEVKAASKGDGFYWSKNEIEVAKMKADQYFLYLIDVHKINQPNYQPTIIQNPAKSIFSSTEWFIEAQSFFIKRI